LRPAIVVIVALIVCVGGVLVGAWWAPYTVCLIVGLLEPQARRAVVIGAGVGLLAWLLPLGAAQLRYGLGPAASSLAAIMGFGHQGAVPVALTLLVGLLLGLSGAWVGSAARRVFALRSI
jgi:hypothetical protein